MAISFVGMPPRALAQSDEAERWLEDVFKGKFLNVHTKNLHLHALSSDPDDPPNGSAVIWLSDGTASGAEGDLVIKRTDSSGTTTTETIDTTAV